MLFAQRDRNEARMVIIDTKREQLSAIVNTYQALGGGWQNRPRVTAVTPVEAPPPQVDIEVVPIAPNNNDAPQPPPNNEVPLPALN